MEREREKDGDRYIERWKVVEDRNALGTGGKGPCPHPPTPPPRRLDSLNTHSLTHTHTIFLLTRNRSRLRGKWWWCGQGLVRYRVVLAPESQHHLGLLWNEKRTFLGEMKLNSKQKQKIRVLPTQHTETHQLFTNGMSPAHTCTTNSKTSRTTRQRDTHTESQIHHQAHTHTYVS